VVSDTQLTAVVPAGTVVGTHQVSVMNADGSTSKENFTLENTGGAFVFFVDPPVIWSGMAVQITAYATLVSGPISTLSIQPHGNASAREELVSMWSPTQPGRVRAVVPEGLDPGAWDVIVTDSSTCEGILENAFQVVDSATLTLQAVDPPFGFVDGDTAVTIRAAGGLEATPRAYLSPTSTASVATAMRAVSFLSPTTLTAVAPAGLMPGDYDLIVVNPDGQVGALLGAFTVRSQAPPIITDLTPGSLDTGATPTITILGSGFATPSVTLTCRDAAGASLAPVTGTVQSANATQIMVQVSTSTLPAGTVCVVTVSNADGSFVDFSALAVTNPASNLEPFRAMPSLTVARRGVAAVAGRPTQASRFLYALGGNAGTSATSALATVERAAIGDFGELSSFVAEAEPMTTGRALHGAARIGEFVYAVGGTNGTSALASVERARILDPLDVPEIVDIDLALGDGTGLGPGSWVYRVSARWPSGDPSNPDGETLASEPLAITLPDVPDRVRVTLTWAPLAGASAYRVYRTPTAGLGAGTEELLTEVTGTTFSDDGTITATSVAPLPVGSLGRWHEVASLLSAREGPAVLAASHPSDPTVWFVYAAGGRNGTGLLATYEVARVSLAADGSQTVDPFVMGAGSIGAARWQVGGWALDSRLASQVPAGTTYLYFGGGLDAAGMPSTSTVVGQVSATGVLSGIASVDPIPAQRAGGAGSVAANGLLFAFGGGGLPSIGGHSVQVCNGAGAGCAGGAPELRNWNSLGGGGILVPRQLMGAVLEGSFIYVLGGETTGGGATATTEGAVW
jgi:hypothetical protein